jgi:DNA-binding transcriptional LysR family regulator
MSDIDTRLFRYFVAVADEQHFARAAERLGITPPTLTHQIQKLESWLGERLFERKGNRKVLVTRAGQGFLTDAREALRQVEQAAVRARQAGRGELGRLELGSMISLFGTGLLQSWTGPFQQAHPAIDIMLRMMVPMAQIAAILRKELDAGFTRPPNQYPSGIRGFEIYRQPMALALPSEHPLAQHADISPAMLAREAFVGTPPEPDLGFLGYTETVARIGNFTPRVVKCDGGFVAVLEYVAFGHGIAVVPATVKTINVSNVVFRNIAADPVPHTPIAFVYGSNPSPSAKLLIRHMRRHALRNGDKGAAPPHDDDRTTKPKALSVDRHPNIDPHPEVLARRASLEGCARGAAASPFEARRRRAEHLRVRNESAIKRSA